MTNLLLQGWPNSGLSATFSFLVFDAARLTSVAFVYSDVV